MWDLAHHFGPPDVVVNNADDLDEGASGLDTVVGLMPPSQIAEAQRLAAEWWEDYQSRQ